MKIAILDKDTLTRGDIDFGELEAIGDVIYCDIKSEEDIVSSCADCDAILCNKIVISGSVMARLPQLKYIGLFATGYNNVDIEAAKAAGITVTNAPDYSTYAVAQHVFAMIMRFASRIDEYDCSVKRGDWSKSNTFSYFPYPTDELQGKTLGVYGYGNIGSKVAEIGNAMGMRVVVTSRTMHVDCPYPYVGDDIFAVSDYLTLHCPLTQETEKLIDKDKLSAMKPTAVLINTARGGLIDERALASALNKGVIAGAALDTLSCEPPKEDNPLLGAKNCVITPHIAWAPTQTRSRLLGIVADNLRAFMDGQPVNVVGCD